MFGIPVDSDKNLSERFGRSDYFAILTKDGKATIIENPGKDAATGAGGEAVKLLVNNGVDIVLAPHMGPKAITAAKGFKLKAYNFGEAKSIVNAIEMFNSGSLKSQLEDTAGLKRV